MLGKLITFFTIKYSKNKLAPINENKKSSRIMKNASMFNKQCIFESTLKNSQISTYRKSVLSNGWFCVRNFRKRIISPFTS